MSATSNFARDPHDYYVEPEWVSRRLFEVEGFHGYTCDPACGSGRIVQAALDAGLAMHGSDIVKRSPLCSHVHDFMRPQAPWFHGAGMDNIVSNPPYGLCQKPGEDFAALAVSRARRKTALLLPATWHVSAKRSRWLETTPLRRIWCLSPRPSMPPGHVIEAGIKPGNGTVDFAWYVWLTGYDGPVETRWLRRDG